MFKNFLKDFVVYGFATVFPRVVSVLLVKLHTTVLLPGAYSVNTSFYVWAAYLNVLLTYGMETAFFRFFTRSKHPSKIIYTAFISLFVSSCTFLLLVFYFAENIAVFMGFEKVIHFKTLAGITFLDTLVVIPYALLRANGKARHYGFAKIFHALLYAVLNVVFLLPFFMAESIAFLQGYFGGLEGLIFFANLIASGVVFLLLMPRFLSGQLWIFDGTLLCKMLRYSLPLTVSGFAYITNENLDKLLMVHLLGKKIMGGYAGAYKIAVFMTLFVMAFRLGAEPLFFQLHHQQKKRGYYADIMNWFVIFGAVLVLFVVAFLQEIATLLLGNPLYQNYLAIVPIILVANLFSGMYSNLSVAYKLTDRTHYTMYISILGAICTAVFLWWSLPRFGFMAAAWTTLFVYFLMATLSYFIGQKIYPIPYPIFKIMFYLGVVSLFSFLMFTTNPSVLFRGLYLMIFVLMVLFLERNFLLNFRKF